jgi:hypothetical protein
MNSTEQRTHRTVTAELAYGLENIAKAAAQRFGEQDAQMRVSISDVRAHLKKLADEQRSYVDARDRELRECCQERWDASGETTKRLIDRHQAFVTRTFWQRLRWVLRGN